MREDLGLVSVNEKQKYHNCEMIFSFYYHNKENGFKVDEEQKYKIHTTIKEIEVLNEALELYQEDRFKENYLLYTSEVDGSNVYPLFAGDYIESVSLSRSLQALANDEDALVQLSTYCLETPPTYEDDFKINKKIESIILDGQKHAFEDFDEIQAYMAELKEAKPALFA